MPTSRRRKISAHEDVVVQFNKLHFDPHNPRNEPEEDEEKIRAEFGAQEETARLRVSEILCERHTMMLPRSMYATQEEDAGGHAGH